MNQPIANNGPTKQEYVFVYDVVCLKKKGSVIPLVLKRGEFERSTNNNTYLHVRLCLLSKMKMYRCLEYYMYACVWMCMRVHILTWRHWQQRLVVILCVNLFWVGVKSTEGWMIDPSNIQWLFGCRSVSLAQISVSPAKSCNDNLLYHCINSQRANCII